MSSPSSVYMRPGKLLANLPGPSPPQGRASLFVFRQASLHRDPSWDQSGPPGLPSEGGVTPTGYRYKIPGKALTGWLGSCAPSLSQSHSMDLPVHPGPLGKRRHMNLLGGPWWGQGSVPSGPCPRAVGGTRDPAPPPPALMPTALS